MGAFAHTTGSPRLLRGEGTRKGTTGGRGQGSYQFLHKELRMEEEHRVTRQVLLQCAKLL